MLNLAQRPDEHGAPEPGGEPPHLQHPQHLYYAFLSYSHKDQEIADWLHREIEEFHVPRALQGKLTGMGVIPKQLSPIFRDRHELAAAGDLGAEIRTALASSQYLIVLCSPAAAKSLWTNAEIEAFKRSRPEGCVLAAIVDGEPFASDVPGYENLECFPPALRHKYDRRGRPTHKRAEPLAADLRENADGKRLGFLKLVAGMLGVGLDDLVHREQTRRQRRLAWIAAASLAGMVVTSGLAITAINARDAARDQRREAEGLISFMLGDLRDKLEPIGRLDALDGVGSRVLAFYRKQDTSELSDAGLQQRSSALSLMAEVANLRGDTPAAFRFYREAMKGTAEAIRRKPDDPERLYQHSQNVAYYGELAMYQGDLSTAEAAMRAYKGLAARMIQLEPDNIRWRLEAQYADFNLGVVLYNQRRFAEAVVPLEQALERIQALAAADPANAEYQSSVPDGLAWVADAKMSQGKIAEAVALREQQVGLLTQLVSRGGDIKYQTRLIKADQLLAYLYSMQGRHDLSIAKLQDAMGRSDRVVAVDPNNTRAQQYSFEARFDLAEEQQDKSDRAGAESQTNAACATVSHLLQRDSKTPAWRAGLRHCWLMRAQLALAAGAKAEALEDANRALQVAKTVNLPDAGDNSVGLAKSYRLIGDVQRALGNSAAAQQAWQNALAAYPKDVAERPPEMSEHAIILERLGRSAEAQQLIGRLQATGYQVQQVRTS